MLYPAELRGLRWCPNRLSIRRLHATAKPFSMFGRALHHVRGTLQSFQREGTGARIGYAFAVVALVWLSCSSLEARPVPPPCREAMARTGILEEVGADASLVIASDDGKARRIRVRLADIGPVHGPASAAVRDALENWVGRKVRLHALARAPDRWQRRGAHVEIEAERGENDASRIWVQAALVRAGLVAVRPEGAGAGCARLLYSDERVARRMKRGIWGSGAVRVLSARDRDLREKTDSYRIVAGIVVSVGATSRKHYLNFGRDWSRDFTVTIPAGRVQAFRAAGRAPETMSGRHVRVRGWLRRWNGAVIDVRYPDEIEVLGKGG